MDWPRRETTMARELPPEERYEIDLSWSDEDDAFVALIPDIPDMPYAGGHGKPIPQPKSRQTA